MLNGTILVYDKCNFFTFSCNIHEYWLILVILSCYKVTHVVQLVIFITCNAFTFYFTSSVIILSSEVELEGISVVILNGLRTCFHRSIVRSTKIIHTIFNIQVIILVFLGGNNAYKIGNLIPPLFVEEIIFRIDFLHSKVELLTFVHSTIA